MWGPARRGMGCRFFLRHVLVWAPARLPGIASRAPLPCRRLWHAGRLPLLAYVDSGLIEYSTAFSRSMTPGSLVLALPTRTPSMSGCPT